ncbi:DUF3365 domain-containing protein [Thiohalocapsa marina]|uniref:DUF3365 domain-containing protein n=1 Tax=Thiohalocapsa marina TaxID=424902 RepID=A0A5M8FGV8_9GAMM|nr:DUF3365 domain-containing protein [Thiohalocapsa marina]KAA6183654.1 DUF3365 domain-containing protein [Thiohalocapsa marina]
MRTRPIAIAAVLAVTALAANADTARDAQQARDLIKTFAGTLQGELQAAMKAGGPVEAVSVCSDRAPAIAAELSEASGWDIGRTSDKPRNAANNTPDAWEQKVLRQFADRQRNGEAVAGMTYAEVIHDDGGKTYRFMQAIPTGQVCLTCHGSDIEPGLAEAIDAAYPDDRARGFALGDLRGAFSLSKPL